MTTYFFKLGFLEGVKEYIKSLNPFRISDDELQKKYDYDIEMGAYYSLPKEHRKFEPDKKEWEMSDGLETAHKKILRELHDRDISPDVAENHFDKLYDKHVVGFKKKHQDFFTSDNDPDIFHLNEKSIDKSAAFKQGFIDKLGISSDVSKVIKSFDLQKIKQAIKNRKSIFNTSPSAGIKIKDSRIGKQKSENLDKIKKSISGRDGIFDEYERLHLGHIKGSPLDDIRKEHKGRSLFADGITATEADIKGKAMNEVASGKIKDDVFSTYSRVDPKHIKDDRLSELENLKGHIGLQTSRFDRQGGVKVDTSGHKKLKQKLKSE